MPREIRILRKSKLFTPHMYLRGDIRGRLSAGYTNGGYMETSVEVTTRTRKLTKTNIVKTLGRKENPRLEILERGKES